MDYISTIIDTTLNSFDFGLVVTINILTYILIKLVDEINGDRKVSVLVKRLIMCFSVIVCSFYYYLIDGELNKLILNSAILAPVFWSWIGKPIVDKFNLGYRKDAGDDEVGVY